ncbi:MAG: L-histidine N(alpha)-methyltransferase [Bernardetiaceae bacterium]
MPTPNAEYAHQVMHGLTHRPKALPAKFLYDAQGSRLFQEIMQLPEYYPTDCETEIFSQQAGSILKAIEASSKSNKILEIIELGAGDGSKTQLLLQHFIAQGKEVTYRPIDISAAANESLSQNLSQKIPQLAIAPITGDYFDALSQIEDKPEHQRLVLFLGSNIGNFSYLATFQFLERLRENLRTGDLCLIGFDLRKDPRLILAAYDDTKGITAAFNLNLLHRLNREWGAHFDPSTFTFFPFYDPVEGVVKSFLVSQKQQRIAVDRLQICVHFEAYEALHTESSRKYSLQEIQLLAEKTGFAGLSTFIDSRRYFTDALWQRR